MGVAQGLPMSPDNRQPYGSHAELFLPMVPTASGTRRRGSVAGQGWIQVPVTSKKKETGMRKA